MGWKGGIIAAAMVAAAACSAAAWAGDGVDIVGLRLGMSLDEAQAAIREYNAELKIQPPVRKTLHYRAGKTVHQTEPYVSYVFAVSGKKQHDDIYVYFSLPPGEPRVVAITRMHNNFDPPIPRRSYYEALVEKYGKPDAGMHDPDPDESRRQVWYQWHVGDGKLQCARAFDGGRKVDGDFGALGVTNVERGDVLARILDPSGQRLANPKVKDPLAKCAALLTYELNRDPVFAARGTLIDVAGAIRSEAAMGAWIEGLRTGGGDPAAPAGGTGKPKL